MRRNTTSINHGVAARALRLGLAEPVLVVGVHGHGGPDVGAGDGDELDAKPHVAVVPHGELVGPQRVGFEAG